MAYLRLFLSCTIFIVTTFSTDENESDIAIKSCFPDDENESDIAIKSCFPDDIVPEESVINLIPYVNINDYDVDAYNVIFEPLTKQQPKFYNFFYGESTTVIINTYSRKHIILHLSKPRIDRLSIEVIERRYGTDRIQELLECHYINSTFVLSFKHNLHSGSYLLKMKYLGGITDNAETFFKSPYSNEMKNIGWLIGGDLKEIRSQHVFPCPYDPRLKSQLNIFIKYHQMYSVLSNVLPEVRHTIDGGVAWTNLSITSVMSTYFVAVPTVDFHEFSYNFANINMWCRRHMMQYMNFAWNIAKNVTTYLQYKLHAESLNKAFVLKQSFVVMPHFMEGNLKNSELIVYREADIMYKESDHSTRKIEVARLITSKVINLRLDNMQSCSNTGFAMFLKAYIIDKVFKNFRMMDLFVVQHQHEYLHITSDFNINQISDIESIFKLSSFSDYFLTPVMLRMLQHLLSDEVFWRGIRKYEETHAFNSTNLKNFWGVMQAVLEESDYKDMFNVIVIMNSWTKPKLYPVLMIVRNHIDEINIGLNNFDSSMHNWSIPVTFVSQSKPDFTNTSLRNVVWVRNVPLGLRSNELFTDLKDDDWIIANLQQAGYYRVNYDTANWARIAKYLNSWSYRKIHVLNRAQIIDDAFHLAIVKNLNISIFWNLVNYLSRDTDYIAWYPMIKALEYMSSIFPLPDRKVQNIKNKIREILTHLLTWIGYIENSCDDDFTKYLKQELAKWACTLGHSWCMKMATRNLELHIEDSINHKVLPWWKEWTYCKGLMLADNTTWNKVMNIWKKKRDNKILEFLACPQNNTIIERYLFARTWEMKLRDNEDVYTFHSIVAKHARNNVMLNIIISHFSDIKPRQVSMIAAITDMMNHVYSEQQLYKVSELMRYLKKPYEDYVHYKIKTRLSEIKQQMDFLEILSGIGGNNTSELSVN